LVESAGRDTGEGDEDAGDAGETKVSVAAGADLTSSLWYSGVGGRRAASLGPFWSLLEAPFAASLSGEEELGLRSRCCCF